MRQPEFPSMSELARYDVNRVGMYEVIREPLYDFQNYAAAGQLQLNFFQVQQGSGGKTIEDTNMELAGALPRPKNFLVESIEIHLFPGDLPVTEDNTSDTDFVGSDFANDVYTILKLGSLKFFIGSKTYVEQGALIRFPPKSRLDVSFGYMGQVKQTSAADEVTAVMGDYAAAVGRPFFVAPRIRLISQQNFKVELNYSAVQATPSSTIARIGVVLDGLLYRESQ